MGAFMADPFVLTSADVWDIGVFLYVGGYRFLLPIVINAGCYPEELGTHPPPTFPERKYDHSIRKSRRRYYSRRSTRRLGLSGTRP